jgi:hypothetical protein
LSEAKRKKNYEKERKKKHAFFIVGNDDINRHYASFFKLLRLILVALSKIAQFKSIPSLKKLAQ